MVQLSGRSSKAVYLILLTSTVVLAILLKFAFEEALNKLVSFGPCNGGNGCLGNQAVYRVSFGSAICFIFYSIFCALHPPFHYRHWLGKIIVFFGLIIVPFWIPNSVFDVYAEIARVLSLFFLILQILLLIDLAYDIHGYIRDTKIEPDEGEGSKNWQWAYLIMSFTVIAAGIVGIGLLFHFYGKCPLHQFFITFTLLLGIIVFIVSVTEKAGVGLLVPSVVFAYCVYVTWKAVFSNPDLECNPHATGDDNGGMVALGLIITAVSLTYTTWSAGVSAPNLWRKPKDEEPVDDPNAVDMEAAPAPKPQKSSVDVPADGAAAGSEDATPAAKTEAVEGEQKFRNHWFFHLVMAMGAIFMSMLLTNWGGSSGQNQEATDSSVESMWIKIISVWLTYLLFLWTVVAPWVFPDRDFGDNHNSFKKEDK